MIECVPNVSEGRRADIVDELTSILYAAPGVRLLHRTSDPSHNRSVFTFVGERRPIGDAAFALVEAALARIDLRVHRGEHPRIGAVDVIPFIPLAGSEMRDCIEVARETGARIGEALGVPVYLYEEAATHPERRHLEVIRRGGFEGLSARMKQPEWTPDFGPSAPHPRGGAVAVGARQILVAYNVNLNTDRLDIARDIARVVRASGGGLPFVKALGVRLAHRSVVQVSMNLTNFARTSVADAFARVRDEASKRHVQVLDSEIVGLIPAAALSGTAPEALQLRGFTTDQILEERLKAAGN
jgi:glutamate formiminotransferase